MTPGFLAGRPWLRGIAGVAGISSPMAALAQWGLPTAWGMSRDDATTRRSDRFTQGQRAMRDAAAPMQSPADALPNIPYGAMGENIVDTARRMRDWMREQNARGSGAQSFDESGFTMQPPPAPGVPPAPRGIGSDRVAGGMREPTLPAPALPTDMGGYAPNQVPRTPGPGVELPRLPGMAPAGDAAPAAIPAPAAPAEAPGMPWWLRNAHLQREAPGGAYINPEMAQRVLAMLS